MASTTVKPFPHVQINVKDNSIASVNIVETLPVHRPLYVMRTQEGPVGVPIWCNTYAEAVAKFGEETFNRANATYFSKAAEYLLHTFTYNGAFIIRYLPEDNATAKYVLFAHVTKTAEIPQYEYDNNGQRKLEFDPETQEWIEVLKKDAYGNVVTEPGVSICFGTRKLAANEDMTRLAAKAITDGYEFPIFAFSAKYAGAYGNDIAAQLFYTNKSNDAADVATYKTLFYNIGFGRREYNSTTINPLLDVYARENMAFSANPDTINPDSSASMALDYVLDKSYSDATHILPLDFYPYESSFNAIGNIIAAYEADEADENGNVTTVASINGYDVTAPIGALTAAQKEAVKTFYMGEAGDADAAREIVEGLALGYMVNGVSCEGITGIQYDHAVIGDAGEGFTKAECNSSSYFYLGTLEDDMGADGTFYADADSANWASDDYAMYQFCNLTLPVLKDTIVESLHYPFTHIFDVGYSIRTKKAILKFLDVRDDFMAIMSSQVLMSDGSGRLVDSAALLKTRTPGEWQAQDEANLEVLRSYALLMRESVLYGTDCMRASIYCHAGILAEGPYVELVPFTLWSAVQYAQYGRFTYMAQSEPRGLPNSYNTMFKTWNWNNYREGSQSRVWDAGGNYVQYADMSRIFYPSLRTVYRAATSVLIDEWFVAAIVYAKYVARRAWATHSGRNDAAAELQGAIKQYVDNGLTNLFNNKYPFVVSVYQTAEEQELGYIQHVKMSITSPATMRVLDVDIEANREGFVAEE